MTKHNLERLQSVQLFIQERIFRIYPLGDGNLSITPSFFPPLLSFPCFVLLHPDSGFSCSGCAVPFSLLPVLFGSKMVLQEAQWAYEPSGVASEPAPHSGHFRAMLTDRAAASVCREERVVFCLT